jgi:aspartate/methionine/tyrosine aminotransferase
MSAGPTADRWIAERMRSIEMSGIRKVFELARALKNPVDLSIGQPDFDVPQSIKAAAHAAIDQGYNGYTLTQGIPQLRERLLGEVRRQYPNSDRELFLTSGTSGGLVLSLLATVNPGDEVIVFEPYFVSYPHLVTLAGGTSIYVDTYPGGNIDVDRVKAALSPRTKAILFNSPANPTGVVYPQEVIRDLAQLADRHGVLLISDEIYRSFCHDGGFHSPAEFNDNVLVVDGFSKTYGMTGWRLGFLHGPKRLVAELIKLQQFTFVCAPSIVQHAGLAASDHDIAGVVHDYRRKRDRVRDGLRNHFELFEPGGAFYLFAEAPWGTGTEFVAEAIRNNLLIIPGNVFSRRDTHFRISYAAPDKVLDQGIDILKRISRRKG